MSVSFHRKDTRASEDQRQDCPDNCSIVQSSETKYPKNLSAVSCCFIIYLFLVT